MGDWFQTLVDRDATAEEAPALAAYILQWLIKEQIVKPDATDCVLGGEFGYPPGQNYSRAVDENGSGFLSMQTNGLEIIVRRSVIWSGQGEVELICSACGRFSPPDRWADAIAEWHEGRGPGMLACPGCGASQSVAECPHNPAWGFGQLAFQFWNWPTLGPSFVDEITRRTEHRVVLVAGKL